MKRRPRARRRAAPLRALLALGVALGAHWWWFGGEATRARLETLLLNPLRQSAPARILARDEATPVPDLEGRVVKVADGDTVSLLDSARQQHRLRLYGIDAPEWDQPHGEAAKKALASLVAGKQVQAVVVDRDSLDRAVAVLYLDGRNVNLELVSEGHAWWYEYFAPDATALAQAQQEARAQGHGLWAGPEPVAPWIWRRGRG